MTRLASTTPQDPALAPSPHATRAAQRVARVLARFELACPSLRDHQVTVEILGRAPQVLVLPAAGPRRKGRVDLVVTTKGRLRTCQYPEKLTPAQRASVEDLAWAVYEALSERAPAVPLRLAAE